MTRDCFAFIVWLISHFFCLSICLAFLLIHKKQTSAKLSAVKEWIFVMDIDGYSNSSFELSVSIFVIPWALMRTCDTSTVINRCIRVLVSIQKKTNCYFSLSHAGTDFLLLFLWFLLIFFFILDQMPIRVEKLLIFFQSKI